tara:strand:+ start:2914 stop:4044 length:1131 start_codon:yes stop_codon:yes gene_type:complete
MIKNITLFMVIVFLSHETSFGSSFKIKKVTEDREKSSWFMPREIGWLSGDAAHSIVLDKNRILWIFGDTWTGKFENNTLIPDKWYVNNSIAIQQFDSLGNSEIEFVFGKELDGRAYFPNKNNMPGKYLWPTNGLIIDNSLYVFCQAVAHGEDGWFSISGSVIIEVLNKDDHPKDWIKRYYDFNTPEWNGNEFQIQYHSALFEKNLYIYFMGFTIDDGKKKAILSRMLKVDFIKNKNSKNLEHLVWKKNLKIWSKATQNRVYIFEPGNTESNIQYISDWDLYVTTTYTATDNKILLTYSKNLEGPWSDPEVIFENPIINCPDKTCIETYAVRSHPEFSQKTGELIISYVTSYTGDYKHANINSYRPRFIKVQLEKVN